MKSVTLATVCGTLVDEEFLLGMIRHHAAIVTQFVVLNVTSAAQRRRFRGLPDNVVWIYDDSFASGDWKTFRCRPAVIKCTRIAAALGNDLVMWIDSDELVMPEAREKLFAAVPHLGAVDHPVIVWGSDGMPYFKAGSYLRRVWDSKLAVEFPPNLAWQKHPEYDGNRERHPLVSVPTRAPIVKVREFVHHHLHWAFPQKGLHSFGEWEIAKQFPRDGIGVWPEPLQRWRFGETPPSQEFL